MRSAKERESEGEGGKRGGPLAPLRVFCVSREVMKLLGEARPGWRYRQSSVSLVATPGRDLAEIYSPGCLLRWPAAGGSEPERASENSRRELPNAPESRSQWEPPWVSEELEAL